MKKKSASIQTRLRQAIQSLAVIMVAGAISVVAARADNWPNWRGPSLDGVAAGKGYPAEWGPNKNILWQVQLPGPGASSPAVWEDRIIVTCSIAGKNAVVCFDRAGQELWRKELGSERSGKHAKATGSNPSPVTDGTHIYLYFKSGELSCLNMQGNVIWEINLQQRFGEDTLWWDLGTSPVLSSHALVVAVMQTGPSYLVAFDKLDGRMLWKHDRNLGAPEEAAQSYSTPVVIPAASGIGETLVVLGADHVTAHDSSTGDELWRVGGLNPTGHKYFRSIASPVISDGIVIAPYARGETLTGVTLGGSGDVTQSHLAWERKDLGADVPTPAAVNGRVLLCTDKGTVACLAAKTGKTIWTGELEKNRSAYSASPIIVDGKILLTREDGVTFVLEEGDEFKVLARNVMDEMIVATPACVDGQIFLRGRDHLWCIASPVQ